MMMNSTYCALIQWLKCTSKGNRVQEAVEKMDNYEPQA